MMDQPALAKLTLPDVSPAIPRDRLFQQIDTALQHSGLWISAPGGSGKTVLAASYLAARKRPVLWMRLDAGDSDPATFFYYLHLAAERQVEDAARLPALFAAENLPALAQFTRTFFRDLYQALPQDCVLVFDNAQDQMLNEQANQLLVTAITEAPENIKIIIISRTNPLKSLSNARMRGRLTQIDWSELSFRSNELEQLAKNQTTSEFRTEPDEVTIKQAIKYSKGWVAGFLLLLQKKELKASPPVSIEPALEQDLFDYFATEIFAEQKDDHRQFLLQTAFLPTLTPKLAKGLTHNQDSAIILNDLVRSNHFTVSHAGIEETSFEYHPLFRRFLLMQAQLEFSGEEIKQIQSKTAHLLIDAGQIEAAVPLLLEAKEWPSLVQVILAQASQLLAQGRHQRLLEWLDKIPAKLLEDDPWLIYWQGIAQMPLNTDKSYHLLSRAFERFLPINELTGASMAWSSAIESLVHSMSDLARMDEWLPKLQILLKKLPEDTAPELKSLFAPQVIAIGTLRLFDEIDIESWLKIAQELLTKDIDPTRRITASFMLTAWFIWKGQPTRAERILDLQQQILHEGMIRPLAILTAKLSTAWFSWLNNEQDRCIKNIEEGLSIANESGVHHWTFLLLIQGIVNALMHGNTQQAQTYFKQLTPRLSTARDIDLAYYYSALGWLEMLEGRPEKALLQQQLALEFAERTGGYYLITEAAYGMSQILYAIGDLQQADHFLAQIEKLAEQYESNALAFQCGLLYAWYQYKGSDLDAAADTLQATFEHAKKEGYCAFFWWLPDQIAELCAFALTRDIEPLFIKNFIQKFNLPPPKNSSISSEWPWPIRIETLGTFGLTINNEPLQFTSKAQHRPVDLIKALVAMGGTGVSSEHLAEALWPDAEGDAAARSLQTTLHRVRKLLQHDDAIEVKQGLISLNPKVVWVDVSVLESMLGDIATTQIAALSTLAHNILKLYRGPFLEHEAEQIWTISKREHLRGSIIKGLHRLAGHLRSSGERVLARNLYEVAITVDPLSEDNYRHLMVCYSIANNKAEALAVYNRLCEKLKQQFNTTPSALTIQLAEAITANDQDAVLKLFPNETQSQFT